MKPRTRNILIILSLISSVFLIFLYWDEIRGLFQKFKSDSKIKSLHPDFRPQVRRWIRSLKQMGIDLVIISGKRETEKQAELYAIYQAGGALPAAPPGLSLHEYGLGVDVAQLIDGEPVHSTRNDNWAVIAQKAEEQGISWGGSFGDKPHFYLNLGLPTSALLELISDPKNVDFQGYLKLKNVA